MIPLNSLFVQLAETSCRASLVIAALLLLRPWLRRATGSQWLCVLWLVVLVRLLVPVSVESPWSAWNLLRLLPWHDLPLQQAPAMVSSEEMFPKWQTRLTMEASTEASAISSDLPVPKNTGAMTDLPGLIWVAGALAGFAGLGWRIFQTRRLAARACAVTDPQLLEVFRLIDPELRRNVELRINDAVATPTLAGLHHPQIWVPRTCMEQLSSEELRYVLLHELGHARRRDLLVCWLFLVAQCLHWFNPLIWIAGRLARADREMACDAWVLARANGEEASEYGLTLLKVVQSLRRSVRTPAVVLEMATSRQDLTERVSAIGAFHHIGPWRGVMVAIAIAVVLMLVTSTTESANRNVNDTAAFEGLSTQASANPTARPVKADVLDSTDASIPPREDLRVEFETTLVKVPSSVWQRVKRRGFLGDERSDDTVLNQVRVLTEAQRAALLREFSKVSGMTKIDAKKISVLSGTSSSIAFPLGDGVQRTISIAPEVGADYQTIDLKMNPEWTGLKLARSVTLFTGRTVLFRVPENAVVNGSGGFEDRSEFLVFLITARIKNAAGKLVIPKSVPPPVEISSRFIELTDEAMQHLKLDSLIRAADIAAGEHVPVIWDDAQRQAFLQTAEKMKGADLVNAPKVTTRSGQRAVIEIIREFRYPKTWKPDPEKPGEWLAETWETRNAGATLEAEPKVNDGEMLTLNLKPQVVEALGFVDLETGKPAPGHRRKQPDVIQPSGRSGIDRSSIDRLLFGHHPKITGPEMADYKFVPGHRNTMVFSERSAHQNVTLKAGQSVVLVLKETADTRPFEDEAPKGHLIAIVTAETIKFPAAGTVVAQ